MFKIFVYVKHLHTKTRVMATLNDAKWTATKEMVREYHKHGNVPIEAFIVKMPSESQVAYKEFGGDWR